MTCSNRLNAPVRRKLTLILLPAIVSAMLATLIVSRAVAAEPPIGSPTQVADGVICYEINVPTNIGTITKTWVYLPNNAARGARLPCVVIAPAGSILVAGMGLADSDRPEHIPMAQAGFAVIVYSLDGPLQSHPTWGDLYTAAAAFERAHAGMTDERCAVNYVLSHFPQIDPRRLYSAGHSSAANVALLAAATDPRIKGCAAYAPVFDIPENRGSGFMARLERGVPGDTQYMRHVSPSTIAGLIKCPVLIFHADDDRTVPLADDVQVVDALKRTNRNVKFVRVLTGDHYQSMIDQGIPAGIAFFKSLAGL